MTNSKTTKRALLSSVVALLVCFAMLLGTTYAWFTDSVTSAGNIIKSGTLDVQMHWAEGKTDPANTTWTDASTGAIFNNDKWEPGYVEVRHIKISNVGTLALKYQLHIFANGDVSDLADVIDVYFVDPAVQVADRTALNGIKPVGTLTEVLAGMPGNASGDLKAEEVDTITLALKMRENAGNEYQNKAIGSDFTIQLLATQLTSENDSFGNNYDGAAPYFLPVGMTAEDFGDNVAYVDGTYYATLTAALNAIHNSNATESVLYLKPSANLGTITHAHVCSSITIYGNDAYISGGDGDFEIGTPQASSITCTIDSAIELNIYDLDGCAVWGTIPEGADVSVSLHNCENVSKIVLPNYTTGNYDLSVSIDNCTFVGTDYYRDSAIWCRGLDNLTITNTTFKNYKKGVNQNNKDAGVENYTLTNCTFIDCSIATYGADAESAPVRAVASASGATVNLTMTDCEFIYTGTETAINGDVLTYQDGNAGTVNVVRN